VQPGAPNDPTAWLLRLSRVTSADGLPIGGKTGHEVSGTVALFPPWLKDRLVSAKLR